VIVLGTSHVDAGIAGMQLDVLVALDVFDAQVSGREADVEIGPDRHVNDDLQPLVAGTVGRDAGVTVAHVGASVDSRQLIGVSEAPLDPDAIVRAA
jgi:hypothetical protein